MSKQIIVSITTLTATCGHFLDAPKQHLGLLLAETAETVTVQDVEADTPTVIPRADITKFRIMRISVARFNALRKSLGFGTAEDAEPTTPTEPGLASVAE